MTKVKQKTKNKAHPPPRTRKAGSARSRPRVAKSMPRFRFYEVPRVPDKVKAKYLEAMCRGEYHSDICEALNVIWRQISLELCHDPEFAKAFKQAEAVKCEVHQMKREEIADQRGMVGWDEPVFYQGVECGSVRRFSDTLLLAQMKKAKPLDYADRHVHMGADGGAVAWAQVPPQPKSLDDWEKQVRKAMEAEFKQSKTKAK